MEAYGEWVPFGARLAQRVAILVQSGGLTVGTPLWLLVLDQILLRLIDSDLQVRVLRDLLCGSGAVRRCSAWSMSVGKSHFRRVRSCLLNVHVPLWLLVADQVLPHLTDSVLGHALGNGDTPGCHY